MVVDLIIAAIVILSLLFRGVAWVVRSASRAAGKIPKPGFSGAPAAPPRTDQTAMASRQVSPQMGRPPLSSTPSLNTPLSNTPPPAVRPRRPDLAATRRRPEAGGPAVTREATTADLYAQEAELEASEPDALAVPLQSNSSTASNSKLFSGSSDFLRAFILQEVLGPPISRRSHR